MPKLGFHCIPTCFDHCVWVEQPIDLRTSLYQWRLFLLRVSKFICRLRCSVCVFASSCYDMTPISDCHCSTWWTTRGSRTTSPDRRWQTRSLPRDSPTCQHLSRNTTDDDDCLDSRWLLVTMYLNNCMLRHLVDFSVFVIIDLFFVPCLVCLRSDLLLSHQNDLFFIECDVKF